MLRRPAIPLAALLSALTAGCPGDESPAAPAAEAWTAQHTGRVEAACARCHALPPADALPRDRWPDVVASMSGMPGPVGVAPATAEEVALATAYYTRRAPAAFEPPTREEASEEAGLELDVERYHPDHSAFAARIPAVANVAFVHLSDPRRADLLVSEMRSSALFLLPAWAPPEHRKLRHLAKDLDYPAHVALSDVNGDGRQDLLVAALGGMNPSNATSGRVHLRLQDARRRFRGGPILTGVGRAADARAVDLDGDGDQDVVAAAFGWRGPGALWLLERTGGEAEAPTFARRELDPRDGFIHVEPSDLDGDGDTDLVALLAQEHEQVIAFLNQGELRLEPRVLFAGPHPAWGASGLELVDLDGDGDTDVLVSNGDALDDDLLKPYHGVSWLENVGGKGGGEGELRFEPRRIGALYGCERAVAGDLDGDGDQDVLAVSFLPQLGPEVWRDRDLDSIVWFEQTAGGWTRRVLEKRRCYHPTAALADLDADGDVDAAVGNYVWLVEDGEPAFRADMVTILRSRQAD